MSKSRILIVHNRYQQRGGEDAVVEAEVALLRAHGHAVRLYARSNDEVRTMTRIGVVADTLWSRQTSHDITDRITRFRPDVVHVHNTFPLVSASLYWAASRLGVPVIQTLHNFRLLCPQAMFLRDGHVCEDCLGKIPWRAVTRRCYHDSFAHSAVQVAALGVHRVLHTYDTRIDRYIALTAFCRDKFVAGGLPADKIAIKPNFVDMPPAPATTGTRRGLLFAGRLAPEKGTAVLLQALDLAPELEVDVVGSGPDEQRLRQHPRVRMLGWLAPQALYDRMQHAACLVMPSIWYENFPRTLVEAFASGLPVIGSRLGALAEIIDDGHTGLLFETGSAAALAEKMRWALANPQLVSRMGENARAEYDARFTPERNYEQLAAIYGDVIAAKRMPVAV
ncbi:MAG TPA: glycosyltransferase family 4 protein [Burkholderiales bacterium]|nr:glycosyltransferase family 4 protein [Burkholderiales bacterium]